MNEFKSVTDEDLLKAVTPLSIRTYTQELVSRRDKTIAEQFDHISELGRVIEELREESEKLERLLAMAYIERNEMDERAEAAEAQAAALQEQVEVKGGECDRLKFRLECGSEAHEICKFLYEEYAKECVELKADRDKLRDACREVIDMWDGKGGACVEIHVIENLRAALGDKEQVKGD